MEAVWMVLLLAAVAAADDTRCSATDCKLKYGGSSAARRTSRPRSSVTFADSSTTAVSVHRSTHANRPTVTSAYVAMPRNKMPVLAQTVYTPTPPRRVDPQGPVPRNAARVPVASYL
jgi:hypothetical protein